MNYALNFTDSQADQIEALRERLANRIGRPVFLEQDSTDCGQHWAALCVESLPSGSWGQPGPLVTFVTGTGIATGLAILDFNGTAMDGQVDAPKLMEAARSIALRAWRHITSPHVRAVG